LYLTNIKQFNKVFNKNKIYLDIFISIKFIVESENLWKK